MTSMPEVAAEWQNFDQLTADKLYELLRFRHDLCDS
jgi:predicted GNAT family N-acyltransferase